MKLLYEKSDLPHSNKLRDERFKCLAELGASEFSSASLCRPDLGHRST